MSYLKFTLLFLINCFKPYHCSFFSSGSVPCFMEFQSWIKPNRLSDHNHHKVILLQVDFFIETSTAARGE